MNRSSTSILKQDFETNPLAIKARDSACPQLPILLAEDDPISRLMMKKALNNAGYEVTPAENGYQALKIFNQQEFPIIITDWIMPEMDGLDLCRSIRSMSTIGYVFIMILTTNDSKEDIALGLDAGADDYLTKPFHPLELFARIKAGSRVIALERSLRESNTRQKNHIQFIESLINTVPSPVFLVIRGTQVFSLPDTADNQGPPLGVLRNATYSAGDYQLKEGDKLIFYTDGLIEMPLKNKDKMLSSTDLQKMIQKIMKKHPDQNAASVSRHLLKNTAKLSGEIVIPEEDGKSPENSSADDVTLLCIDIVKKVS